MRVGKRYLIGIVGIAAAALLLSGCAGNLATPTAAAAETPPTGITVVGEGKATAAPDVAYISLGVETTGDTAKAAMDENATRMNQVVDKIKGLGIAEKDIQTSGVNLYPVYDQRKPGPEPVPSSTPSAAPQIVGYRASNSVRVTVNDLKRAPEVLDGVIGAGANNVSGLQFSIKDDSKLRQQALADASKQSQSKAKAIADALGVKITGIASVQENYGSNPVPLRAAMPAAAAGTADSTPVMAGELDVTAQVTVTYSYQ